MTYTSTDLIRETLRDLTRLGNNQTVDADDSAAITALLPSIAADLMARDVYPLSDLTAIPEEAFSDLIRVVAERVAPRFGRKSDYEVTALAERNLRRLTVGHPDFITMEGHYF